MKTSFFAVGHSNRTLEFLVGLVLGYEIERLVDVRTVPRSRHNPQFNRDSLPQNLRSVGIAYTLYRGAERRRGAGRRPCRERRFRQLGLYAACAPQPAQRTGRPPTGPPASPAGAAAHQKPSGHSHCSGTGSLRAEEARALEVTGRRVTICVTGSRNSRDHKR